jgi:hypothetical protein
MLSRLSSLSELSHCNLIFRRSKIQDPKAISNEVFPSLRFVGPAPAAHASDGLGQHSRSDGCVELLSVDRSNRDFGKPSAPAPLLAPEPRLAD